jgi:hypothetical protein
VLARERQDRDLSIYKLKRRLSYRGRSFHLPALARVLEILDSDRLGLAHKSLNI